MHKCADCGFLALRFYYYSELHEATKDYREEGVDTDGSGSLSRPPLCLMRAFDLESEVRALVPKETGIGTNHIVEVVSKPRKCKQWRQWSMGFTPKDHREMVDREHQKWWHIGEIVLIAVLSGLFTLLGVWIQARATAAPTTTPTVASPTAAGSNGPTPSSVGGQG